MKLKDLFKSTKTIKSSGLDEVAQEVESQEYIESYNKDKVKFMPNVDYSEPKNFAFYGSAEKYYTDAFVRIKNTYPYDGSEKEKYDWINESTFIDSYIFEHRYPRFNGFANLGYPAWGTLNGSIIDGYGRSENDTYIKTFGGPNESNKSGLIKQFDHANKYSTASLDNTGSTPSGQFRESNLNYNLSGGVTIEMWLKKPSFDDTKTQKEVLFDLWNGAAANTAQYGRLRLELTGASSGSPFLLTALSGNAGTLQGAKHFSLGTNLTKDSIKDWTHVAVTLKNSGSHIQTNLYINGALNQRQTIAGGAMNPVTGTMISYIGALQTAPSGSPSVPEGAGKFSGSIDEFRYWKTERSSKDIGRYYWTNIGAGTNTDEANTDLGVYYKFNEGITQINTTDSVVLDYSGRLSNGAWKGYQEGARSTESAIVLSKASTKEFKDPTIYSTHPDYISTLRELEASGSLHDIENNGSLINSIPGWILEEDNEKEGNLRNLTQAMASYFDNLYLHMQELNSLKNVYAHFQTQTINDDNMTSLTGSTKPLPFADRLLTNAGFVAPELFADATVLESLAARSEDEHYEMKIHDVKNQIYQNVYSSLINIYKRKGTNKSFRNVLHSFGVDEDIVKINFYGDNVDFELNDRHTIRTTKQKFVDFNHPDRFNGTIFQHNSGSNGINYITGSNSEFEKYIPVTFETQVILPNKIPHNEVNGFDTPHTKSVIAGIHEASDAVQYTIPSTDNCEIQIFSKRDEKESKNVEFHLSSSILGVHLSSSLYPNMYENNEWLFAFRIKNDKNPTVDEVSGSITGSNYVIDFLGYNTVGTTVLNSFTTSSAITATKAQNFLTKSKRIYAGAKRTNFTGSLEERTDHKIGFVRYWLSYLGDETLKQHSYDSSNYGAESPFRSTYLMEDSVNNIKIPEIDTLLLNWDFEKLSTSDSSGEFIVEDVTSGSGQQRYVADFENIKRKFYHGKGKFFLQNDEKVIDVEYINAARVTFPDVLQGDDMIDIRNEDDLQFTRNTLPQDYFIAFEKSMSQTISKEMLKFMSSITDFNNLIGRPVDRYRMEYKDLSKLRQLFFERVSNEPDLDKYIDYYKWLDDALGEMLVALVPASVAHSDGINNVIENHVFDRDKYQNKFPTIEFKSPEPEACLKGINKHLYPWKTGHAPIPLEQDDSCYWWLNRAERTLTNALTPASLPTNTIAVTPEGEVWYKFAEPVSEIDLGFTGLQAEWFVQSGYALENWEFVANLWTAGRLFLRKGSSGSNIPAGSGKLFKFTNMTVAPLGFIADGLSDIFKNASGTHITVVYTEISSINVAGGNLNTRQKVFQARNSQLRRSWCTAQHFALDRQRHLHGGTNYEDNKRRDYVWSATRDVSESPLDFGKFGGFPLRYILTNNDMYMALKDCDDERPVTEKIKMAFGAYDGFDLFMHYHSGSHPDGKMKGGMVMPFNVMSSSALAGYSDAVEGIPGGATTNINIVNLHSDTVDNTNTVPMQGPFTERWVGGHQSRHAPVNQGTDVTGSRAEGYKILLGNILNESGSIGIVGPDYPYPYASQMSHPFFYKHQPKARYFREERAKRPVNIKNIETTGSQVGNYVKRYQYVHTGGRSVQKSRLRDLGIETNVHNATNTALPQTTQEASVIARGVGQKKGNLMSNFHTSSLYMGHVKTSRAAYVDHEATGSGDTIMVSRFSAPGGFETMSEVFLNLYGKEKSVYNALPFRNLSVLTDSGEDGAERVVDIHGEKRGLRTHLTRHAAQFGVDSFMLNENDPSKTLPSYHKVNRNSKFLRAETTTTTSISARTATATLYNNASAQREATATSIRNLFANDTTNFTDNGWTIGALVTTNQQTQGARFTITAPSTGTQYDFSNLSNAVGNANNAVEVFTAATSGASSPATLKITVMGRPHELNGKSITFNVKLNGTGVATAFTLNFTNAAGTDSTVWTHSSNTSSTTSTKDRYRHDNGFITHQIPQSDYQYKWVFETHTASLATSSLRGHILSDFTEPSGTSSIIPHEDVDFVVLSQSVLEQRIKNTTGYGFPTWEQIRNNDTNKNVILKKSYGYNIATTKFVPNEAPSGTTLIELNTFEESRVTENINNTVHISYQGSNFKFKYPYVNMKHHFDNINLINNAGLADNETLYESLYGFYSTDPAVKANTKNIRQIVFPRYLKHTKYFDRHRHFFKSHFWTDGENELYNVNAGVFGINETGSYHRLDELGRRETNVTATLFGTEGLNSQTTYMIDDLKYLNNIIPSQSIWSMDARTYFTGGAPSSIANTTTGLSTDGWSPYAAASNSAGAPGVLQNQDHHFHNGISDTELLASGSAATGSFKLQGVTRFGTKSSGSFRVQGVIPTGFEASGSFDITSSVELGASGSGSWNLAEPFEPGVSASMVFDVIGTTVLGTPSTGTFEVSGAHFDGTKTTGRYTFSKGAFVAGNESTGSFTVSDTRQYTAATFPTASFRVSGAHNDVSYPSATFDIGGLHVPATTTTGSFTLDGVNTPGTAASSTFRLQGINRFGDRAAFTFEANSGDNQQDGNQFDLPDSDSNAVPFTIQSDGVWYKPAIQGTGNSGNHYIYTYNEGFGVQYGGTINNNNGEYLTGSLSGFSSGTGVGVSMWLNFNRSTLPSQSGAGSNLYTFFQLKNNGSTSVSFLIREVRTQTNISGFIQTQFRYDLRIVRYFDSGNRTTTFEGFFGVRKPQVINGDVNPEYYSGNWYHFKFTHNDNTGAGWNAYRNGVNQTSSNLSDGGSKTTTGTASGNPRGANSVSLFAPSFSLAIDDLAIWDDDAIPGSSTLYNSGKFKSIGDITSSNSSLLAWYLFGDEGSGDNITQGGTVHDFKGSNDLSIVSNNNGVFAATRNGNGAASDSSYSTTKVRTSSEMAQAIVDAINTNGYTNSHWGATRGSRINSARVYIYRKSLGTLTVQQMNIFDPSTSDIYQSNTLEKSYPAFETNSTPALSHSGRFSYWCRL